jgi:hypothetical protein
MSTKVTAIEREEHATNQLFLLVVVSAIFVTTLTRSFEKSSVDVYQSTANREEA